MDLRLKQLNSRKCKSRQEGEHQECVRGKAFQWKLPPQGVCPARIREMMQPEQWRSLTWAEQGGHSGLCCQISGAGPWYLPKTEHKRSPDSSVMGLNRHSHPGKSEGLFKRSFLKSHVVVCTNYYGERSLSLNLGVCNEQNNVWTEGLVAFQCLSWCCKMRRNLEKIPE